MKNFLVILSILSISGMLALPATASEETPDVMGSIWHGLVNGFRRDIHSDGSLNATGLTCSEYFKDTLSTKISLKFGQSVTVELPGREKIEHRLSSRRMAESVGYPTGQSCLFGGLHDERYVVSVYSESVVFVDQETKGSMQVYSFEK